jgi:alpha-L-rhamnosidase
MMKTGDGKEMDDAFSPGWTNYNDYIYYRTYDVTDYIDGANVALGAKVGNGWYAGIIGRQYYGEIGDDNVNELALLAKLIIKYKDGSSDVIVTNTSDWKVSDEGPVLLNDFFQGEIYDSRLEAGIADWNRWGFDDAGWKYVTRLHYSPKLIGGNSNTAYLLNDDRVYPADGDETYIYDPSNINFSTGLKWGEIVREPLSVP